MAVTTRGTTAPGATLPDQPIPGAARMTPAVKIWAGLGVVLTAFIAYVLISWISGPYFKEVPSGPSDPSGLMNFFLIFWQVITIPAMLCFWWLFIIRPLRREGTVGPDGILVIGFSLMWFQDPLSSAWQHWFVYNTEMVNFGSWLNSVPGVTAYGQPGAMSSEPILFTPAAYTLAMGLAIIVGPFVMRQTKKRFPNITSFWLVAVCFVAMCLYDVVLEGLIWLPMGVFEYPGGHWGIFADTYHKYPLNEMVTIGSVWTALAAVRYFTNDKGQMVIERGVDQVQGSKTRKLVLRGFAAIAFCQVAMFLGYNVPNAIIGSNSTTWPEDLQKRSYFTNYICGDETDRPCPGPGTPNTRDGSQYITTDGRVGTFPSDHEPEGHTIPPAVPFDKGKPGGDE
jgi:Spirocyclase AveC-like